MQAKPETFGTSAPRSKMLLRLKQLWIVANRKIWILNIVVHVAMLQLDISVWLDYWWISIIATIELTLSYSCLQWTVLVSNKFLMCNVNIEL